MSIIHHRVGIAASSERVYDALSSLDGLSRWWAAHTTGSTRLGGIIHLPPATVTNDVDAEGELGVIIGRQCKGLSLEEVPSAIFGYTTTLDLTALDVLARNPRYLTRAKSMDDFFSFGPVIVTADEIPDGKSNYKVEWKGPQNRFCVIRVSDSAMLHKDCRTKQEAEDWLRDHEKTVTT